jgi:hypothetical protein
MKSNANQESTCPNWYLKVNSPTSVMRGNNHCTSMQLERGSMVSKQCEQLVASWQAGLNSEQ